MWSVCDGKGAEYDDNGDNTYWTGYEETNITNVE
jgi:hypothetical protein